jgi:hypothetical protein
MDVNIGMSRSEPLADVDHAEVVEEWRRDHDARGTSKFRSQALNLFQD